MLIPAWINGQDIHEGCLHKLYYPYMEDTSIYKAKTIVHPHQFVTVSLIK